MGVSGGDLARGSFSIQPIDPRGCPILVSNPLILAASPGTVHGFARQEVFTAT
jgi:hypothetical protein